MSLSTRLRQEIMVTVIPDAETIPQLLVHLLRTPVNDFQTLRSLIVALNALDEWLEVHHVWSSAKAVRAIAFEMQAFLGAHLGSTEATIAMTRTPDGHAEAINAIIRTLLLPMMESGSPWIPTLLASSTWGLGSNMASGNLPTLVPPGPMSLCSPVLEPAAKIPLLLEGDMQEKRGAVEGTVEAPVIDPSMRIATWGEMSWASEESGGEQPQCKTPVARAIGGMFSDCLSDDQN